MLESAIAKCHSVCPSVRLSITLVIHSYTVQDIEILFKRAIDQRF